MSKKITCLLLSLVFLSTCSVPVVWGDDTPVSDGGEIHPWDNNDDQRRDGGALDAMDKPIVIIQFGPGGLLTVSWTRVDYTSSQTSGETSRVTSGLEQTAQAGTTTVRQR